MSQSTLKNMRKVWKKSMIKASKGDFDKMIDDMIKQKKTIRKQKIIIICLSVLLGVSIIIGVIGWT